MAKAYVYAIRSDIEGTKVYVGKTVNVEKRWKKHCGYSRNHPEMSDLYADMNKLGAEQFRIEVVSEHETEEEAYEEEATLIEELRASGVELYQKSRGWQASTSERMKGCKHSDATRAKIGEAMKGRKKTDEHRVKIKETLTGRSLSDEHCAKISEATKEALSRPEVRARLSEAAKRRKNSFGRKVSDETRTKMRSTMNLPEVRAKISAAVKAALARKRAEAASTDPS